MTMLDVMHGKKVIDGLKHLDNVHKDHPARVKAFFVEKEEATKSTGVLDSGGR